MITLIIDLKGHREQHIIQADDSSLRQNFPGFGYKLVIDQWPWFMGCRENSAATSFAHLGNAPSTCARLVRLLDLWFRTFSVLVISWKRTGSLEQFESLIPPVLKSPSILYRARLTAKLLLPGILTRPADNFAPAMPLRMYWNSCVGTNNGDPYRGYCGCE